MNFFTRALLVFLVPPAGTLLGPRAPFKPLARHSTVPIATSFSRPAAPGAEPDSSVVPRARPPPPPTARQARGAARAPPRPAPLRRRRTPTEARRTTPTGPRATAPRASAEPRRRARARAARSSRRARPPARSRTLNADASAMPSPAARVVQRARGRPGEPSVARRTSSSFRLRVRPEVEIPAAAAIDSCPTSVSTQPRLPHAQRRPSASTVTWPNSPPNPCVPRNSRPPSTTPPPTPTSPKTQMKSSIPTAAPVQCSASAARFDSFSTWTGRPRRCFELVPDGDSVPAQVRREHESPGRLLDEAGDGHRDPDRAQALTGRGVQRPAGGVGQPVEHGPGVGAAIVAIRAALVPHGPRQVLDGDCDVVDVHLEPDADEDVRELERHARAADAAGRRVSPVSRTSSRSRSSLTRLETVPRVSPVPGGDLRPRARPGRRDVPEDDAQVRPSDGRLVGAACAGAPSKVGRAPWRRGSGSASSGFNSGGSIRFVWRATKLTPRRRACQSHRLSSPRVIADAHVDLLMELAYRERRLGESDVFASTWLPLLEQGRRRAPGVPDYVDVTVQPEGSLREALSMVAAFHRAVRREPRSAAQVSGGGGPRRRRVRRADRARARPRRRRVLRCRDLAGRRVPCARRPDGGAHVEPAQRLRRRRRGGRRWALTPRSRARRPARLARRDPRPRTRLARPCSPSPRAGERGAGALLARRVPRRSRHARGTSTTTSCARCGDAGACSA